MFLSVASLILSLNVCFCPHRGSRVNFNDSTLLCSVNQVVVATIWLAYTFIGFTVASFCMAYVIVCYLDYNNDSLMPGCLIFAMYLMVHFILTLLASTTIM